MDHELHNAAVKSDTEVVIIGGGLAGIFAAIKLSNHGIPHILIDNPLPDAKSRVGGFARFSGAKFSLPPAGMGLVQVAGSEHRLTEVIDTVLSLLSLNEKKSTASSDNAIDISPRTSLRKYNSIVLTPSEIDNLLDRLDQIITSKSILAPGTVEGIKKTDDRWLVTLTDNEGLQSNIICNTIFYAAGRLSNDLIINAGASPTLGKGIDVGVRVEFLSKSSLAKLRGYGPDAKILSGNCRTFCLNSPGTIYRYNYLSGSIPGGVVADDSIATANVGILCRTLRKNEILQEFRERSLRLEKELLKESNIIRKTKDRFIIPGIMREIFDQEIINELEEFGESLDACGLWDTRMEHKIHMPLLDWHWSTFALNSSHKTTEPGLYALGDSSGHARGLLQAAVSGWLAAEEFVNVH